MWSCILVNSSPVADIAAFVEQAIIARASGSIKRGILPMEVEGKVPALTPKNTWRSHTAYLEFGSVWHFCRALWLSGEAGPL